MIVFEIVCLGYYAISLVFNSVNEQGQLTNPYFVDFF